MKNHAYYIVAVLFLVAVVTTFNYGCGGVGSRGSSVSAIPAPSNLQVTKTYSTFYLTWADNSNNEAFFSIYVRPEDGGWVNSDAVAGGNTSWNDSGSLIYMYPTATKLYFRVVAADSIGMRSNPSNEVSVTLH
ncbi:MAG: hypothetical protein V1709_07620 [Planctomycetota bacterium]